MNESPIVERVRFDRVFDDVDAAIAAVRAAVTLNLAFELSWIGRLSDTGEAMPEDTHGDVGVFSMLLSVESDRRNPSGLNTTFRTAERQREVVAALAYGDHADASTSPRAARRSSTQLASEVCQ